MTWQYSQSTGVLTHNGNYVATGYAGAGNARNNPSMEGIANSGPIPTGRYHIGQPRHSNQTGPHILPLTPIGHNALGRHSFQIHGDNRTNDASTGCIIMPRSIRDRISSSQDNILEVVR